MTLFYFFLGVMGRQLMKLSLWSLSLVYQNASFVNFLKVHYWRMYQVHSCLETIICCILIIVGMYMVQHYLTVIYYYLRVFLPIPVVILRSRKIIINKNHGQVVDIILLFVTMHHKYDSCLAAISHACLSVVYFYNKLYLRGWCWCSNTKTGGVILMRKPYPSWNKTQKKALKYSVSEAGCSMKYTHQSAPRKKPITNLLKVTLL